MKTNKLVMGLVLVLSSTILSLPGQAADTPYTVVQRGANDQVWERTVDEYSASGDLIPQKHRYVETATGLNHLVDGQWIASSETIDISPDGRSAFATNGQHQVYFPGDIGRGVIKLVTPEGKVLRSQPIGLGYSDGNKSVLLAELTDARGEILPSSNRVMYAKAFTGVKADLLYTYTKAGFEQDIVLREQPPSPARLGLNPKTTRLQVFTEFIDAPEPRQMNGSSHGNQGNGDLMDTTLDFGGMEMGPGQAFTVADSLRVEVVNPHRGRPVYKTWMHIQGRTFLIEELSLDEIQPQLQKLPPPEAQLTVMPKATAGLMVPPSRPILETQTKFLQLARSDWPRSQGMVLDYNLLNTSQTNFTFQGNMTYYISGEVDLFGTTTIEGGAVIKYDVGSSIYLQSTNLNWLASAYRPVIFTAKDDDTVGEGISNSTGNPSQGYYANPALSIPESTLTLSNLRISYALQGISMPGDSLALYDAQFVNCWDGIYFQAWGLALRNVLFQGVMCSLDGLLGTTVDAENVTFCNGTYVLSLYETHYNGGVTMNVTNSVFANMTYLCGYYPNEVFNPSEEPYPVSFQPAGSNNGFYNSPSFGTGVTSGFYPFQSVGAGNFYLTNGCGFQNVGTTNVDSTLLAELRQKTTRAPHPYSWAWIDANTTLAPTVARDTNAASVDLGYHYNPLDYYFGGYSVLFSGTLTLTNGVQVGFGGPFYIEPNARLVSQGKANQLNRLVQCQTVQEQATNWAGDPTLSSDAQYCSSTVNCRFTEFSRLAGPGGHFSDDYKGGTWNFRDCQFRGSQVSFMGQSCALNVGLTNCLFDRTEFNAGGSNLTLQAYNNLFNQGGVWLSSSNTVNAFTFRNNFFYQNQLTNWIASGLTNDHNGYVTNWNRLGTGTGDVIVSNFTFQSSWLGNFYQPPASPLINMGSTNAGALGLYHYTVTTNQMKEFNSTVDIGYHYVAVDGNGNPVDSDSDGTSDYIEDKNGNGVVDSGETAWGYPPIITLQPTSQAVGQGATVTFSVTVSNICTPPLVYQWYFNGGIVSGATNASLTLTQVQYSQAGNYLVIVTGGAWGGAGSTTSSNAVLTVTGPTINLSPADLYYLVGAAPMTIDRLATVSNAPGCSSFSSRTLTVSLITNAQPEDLLAINNQGTSTNQIGVTNNYVTYWGTNIATFSGGASNNALVINFLSTPTVTTPMVQALLTNINYRYYPSTTGFLNPRTVQFVLSDCYGNTNYPARKNIYLSCPWTLDVMLVLDCSGSMADSLGGTNSKISAAKAAAISFITQNMVFTNDQVGLVTFTNTAVTRSGLTNSPSQVTNIINGLAANGNTDIGDGIGYAQTNFPASIGQGALPVMILLTDGLPNEPPGTNDTNYCIIKANLAKQAGIRLITIGLGTNGDFDPNLLTRLASSPSDFIWATNTGALAPIYHSIGCSLCRPPTNAPPVVQIIAPTNNASFNFGASITVTAAAYDVVDTVASVQFYYYRNGGLTNLIPGTVTQSGTNWSVVWTNAPVGSNAIYAVATDYAGLMTTSAPPVNITVVMPMNMSVSITQPANNALFLAPATVPISATVVSNSSSIQRVDFYANGIWIGADTTSLVNPYGFTWYGMGAGNYTLTAKATDVSGNTNVSPGVLIHMALPVQVNAGTNQVVVLTNSLAAVTMNGSVSGGYLIVTSLWSQVAGPANATIVNPTNTHSSVIFTTAGSYLLRLVGADVNTGSSASDTVVIYVENNQPPVVDAGPNRIIAPSNTVFLNGSVTDDGLPAPPALTSWWSVISGPVTNGITFTNRYSPVTLASNFTVLGVYTLRLTATDGMATNSSDMTVTVTDPTSRTYTYDADFAEGELANVNYDDVSDQLQLNHTITPFPFVWVACSARGTIVRIDANTGQVLGEYNTVPQTIGFPNPSRTTVDKYGNVWVANRCDNLNLDPTTNGWPGSISRVGIVIGGTRGYKTNDLGGTNYTFVPDPNGEYLQPPFKYCTAIDRDGDGLIKTSKGLGDILGWDTNQLGSNNLGGVSLADDECIINYTRVAAYGARTIAVDANNDVWVGGTGGAGCSWGNHWHQKVSGVTGLPIANTAFYAGHGGYGGLIDGNGVLWSANDLFRFEINRRFDMATNPPTVIDPNYIGESIAGVSSYGVSVDPNSGNVWCCSGDSVYRISPDGSHEDTFTNPHGSSAGGMAIDDQGNVWVASHSGGNYVAHFRTDGTFVGNIELGCSDLNGPTGVAIDANGKVWAACMNTDKAMRIDPNRGPRMLNDVLSPAGYLLGDVDLITDLDTPGQRQTNSAQPYNYSDMTGFVSLGATEPSGIWRVVHDSSVTGQHWGILKWNSSEPPGTGIKVEARASDNYSQLSATNNLFLPITNGVSFSNLTGRYMEIRATFFHKEGTNATPVLYDLTVSSGTNAVVANTANFANSDRATMLENRGPLVINVLSNDVAPAGAHLTITKVSPASSGYVTIGAGATNLIYTPNTNFFGVDRFSYTATDGQGGIGRAVVTVEVGQAFPLPPTNSSPPVVRNTNIVVFGNSMANPIDVLALCSDTNSPPLADTNVYIYSVTQPAHGYVRITACDLYYTPNYGYFGPDSFTYTVRNSVGLTASASVNITVTGQPPIPISCGMNTNATLTTNNSTISLHNYYNPTVINTYTFVGDPSKITTISYSGYVSMQVYDPAGQPVYSPIIASSTNTYTIEVGYMAYYFSAPIPYTLSMSCSNSSVPQMAVLMGTNGVVPNGGGIDFGITKVGHPVPAYLTITNYGTTNLNVYSEYFSPYNTNFILMDSSLSNVYSRIVIPANSSSNLTVWFEALPPGGQTNSVMTLYGYSDDYSWSENYTINLLGRANPTNTVPPSVVITNPLPGTVFTAGSTWYYNPIVINATATPAAGASIWAVNFYAQGTNGNIPIGQEFSPDYTGNYTFYWYDVPPGNYTLTAVAIDNSGLQKVSAPVTITVLLRDTNSPNIQVLWGTNNLTTCGALVFSNVLTNVTATATLVITNLGPGIFTNDYLGLYGNYYFQLGSSSPQDGFTLQPHTSTNVILTFASASGGQYSDTFYFGGNDEGLLGECSGYYPGEFDLNLTGIATNRGVAPTVVVTSPASNSVFVVPNDIPVTALATPSSGRSIGYVVFYANSANGNTYSTYCGNYGNNVWSNVWQNATAGQYTLTAMAVDDQGNVGASAPIPVTVSLRPTNSPVMQVYLFQTNAVPNYAAISYGISQVGIPITASFVVSNAGNAALDISTLMLSDTNNFSISRNFDLPLTLSTGGSTNFTLTYNAVSPGSASSVLTIYDNDLASQPFYITNVASANPANNLTPPTVSLSAPFNGAQFAYPSDITVTAVAASATNSSLWGINFYLIGPTSNTQIGQALAAPGQTNMTNSIIWSRPAPGTYSLSAVAIDSSGLMAQSTNPVVIQVVGTTNGPVTNTPPIARDDTFIFMGTVSNSITYPLDVLANDSDPNGYPLTLVGFADPHSQMGTYSQQGNRILFTLKPLWYGTNSVNYEITDGLGNYSLAWATIIVIKGEIPNVNLVSPTAGADITLSTNPALRNLPLVAYASTVNSNGSIANVTFYDQDQPVGTATAGISNIFTYTWRTPPAGSHYLAAVATDNIGLQNITPYISFNIEGKSNNTPPMAAITNLQTILQNLKGTTSEEYPLITNGIVSVLGTARDADAGDTVTYQLLLQKPDGTLVANITPGADPTTGYRTGTDQNGVLASNLDLSLYENGVYDIVLNVYDGWVVSSDSARILLNTQLKIGNFSFSVQDVALPVSGMPLTVTRTYNSLNHDTGDFGYSWTYTLNDLNIQLDEDRQDTPDIDGNTFSLRVGGGRDVTLTLPDGRTVTFQFYFDGPRGAGGDYYAAFRSPPGVNYTLTAYDPSVPGNVPYYDGLTGYWNLEAGTGFDSYDFPGFILTAQDNTKYIITRSGGDDYFYASGDDGEYSDNNFYVVTYGAATLSEIDEPNGDRITINGDEIDHYNPVGTLTRSIRFQRDNQNRITAIKDPNSTNGLPVMTYEYDSNSGNLIEADKLESQISGVYDSTFYQYTNSNFPHFMTGMINPGGVPLAENFYDSSGRLIAMQDANGNLTQFINNLTNNIEVVIDRLGRTNICVYDLRGNVIAETNALGQVTLKAYDNNNNKTNQITFLNGQPYATNSYVYDGNNRLLASTDPLGHTNGFTYDGNGNVKTSANAKGNTTAYNYDSGNNLISITDALGHGTTNSYGNGLLVGSSDAIGTVSANYYDGSENLIATATLDASGIILNTNSFSYDSNGNQTSSTVWRRVNGIWVGATTTYIYDAQNRVVQTIDPDGGRNTVVYNAIGKQQATVDPLGRTTSYTYDALSRLIQTTYPDLTTETSAYDAAGNCTNSMDRLGRTTTYTYDSLNRLTKTSYPDGTTNTTIYDGVGRVVKKIDARGTITAFAYDVAGRRLAVTNAFGTSVQLVSTYGYDANGNRITFTDANNHTTTNVFDAVNRQVQVQFPDKTTMGTSYDADGRCVAQTNQDQLVTRFGYDGAGRLISVTNALNQVTRYQYDEAGNETAQIDALNHTNTFAYDSMGRRIQHFMPGNQSESFAYDLTGNLIYQTNFNGAVITNLYDVMNRLTNSSSINGYHTSYAYTPAGQRATMTDASGATSYSYDNRNRLQIKTVNWNNGPVVSLNYAYDANGDVTNLWSSTTNGVNLAYNYDPLGRLTNVLANGSAAAGYGFDAVGNLQAMRYGNGVTNLYQYDSLNRLTNGVWKLNASTLASFYYQAGLTGNRTNLSETVNGTSRTYAWNYDSLYRMTNEAISGGIGNVGYGYDPVGNRTNRQSSITQLPTASSIYNPNDWLTNTDKYDNNGSTTNSAGNTYQYDVLNHVTNVNNTIFLTYDGDGNRASKTIGGTTTCYLLDDRNPSGYVQVLEEWTSTGTPSLSKVYNYGLDLISQRQPNTSTNYFVYDGHGSTRLLADIGGNVVNAFAYDAYGTLIASNAAPQTAYLYCGEQFDSDLGLYYLRARYLNPNTGRFWTMDTDEGNNQDPLSLHKYLYCQANPVIGTDPSGHQDMISLMISLAIGEDLDADEDVVDVGVDVAFTAHIVDIYACMRKFYKTVRNVGDWPIHFWVYANQPGNKGLRYDIDFEGPTSGAFTGAPGKLNVKPDTLQDVKNESWCGKVCSLNEIQYAAWNGFVGVDAATLDDVNSVTGSTMYQFTYWLGALPAYALTAELSEVSNCLIFTVEASVEAKLMSMGH